ncbi:hypothetical protein MK139_02030 [bacterium]|nr:hypothetical protein [Gemmatimonadota bacterium]MCH2663094.1 hypothetical protein [bacterium]
MPSKRSSSGFGEVGCFGWIEQAHDQAALEFLGMGTELLRLTEIRYLNLTFTMDQQQDVQRTAE